MTTNLLPIPSSASARYWSELKDLSDNVKLELITLLSGSMVHPVSKDEKAEEGWASRFCGVWEDSRSAEEIVDDIRDMRTTNRFDVML